MALSEGDGPMDESVPDDAYPQAIAPPPGSPYPAMRPPPNPPNAPPAAPMKNGWVKWTVVGIGALFLVAVVLAAVAPPTREAPATTARLAPPLILGLSASPANPAVGDEVSLVATVTPATADLYRWRLVSPDGSTAVLSYQVYDHQTFTPDVAGSYEVYFVATDNSSGLSTRQTLTITTR